MTCDLSRDNWHSYVKNSLNDAELDEMTNHLEHCSECRNIVSAIQETANILAKNRVVLPPPSAIRINVMMAIDKNKYKVNLTCTKPQAPAEVIGCTNALAKDGRVSPVAKTQTWMFEIRALPWMARCRDGDKGPTRNLYFLTWCKENLAVGKPQAKKCANSSHLFDLKNWGLSMVAAGILLFTLNLTSLTPNFEVSKVTELNSELGKQIAFPFDKMSQVAHDALGKIESITLSKPN